MLTRNICRVLLVALLTPAASMALGLGDIHLRSALNAPLDADIDVVGASPDELAGLKASLASRDTFSRSHLDYPAFLSSVRLEPRQTTDGRTVLHVQSSDAVNEPIATMLVEVNWARGHLVREYTVLLDPPVFSSASTSAAATAVAAPVSGDAAHSGNVERHVAPAAATTNSTTSTAASPALSGPATATRSHIASPPPGAGAVAATPGSSTYSVRRGDTLSSIAAQAYGPADHATRQRELVAVYRANASSFEGNMNLLRSGSQLSLPGESEVLAISPGEAAAEIHQQYSSWNAAHGVPATGAAAAAGAGQLHLVPPPEAAPKGAATTPAPSPASQGAGAGAAGAAASVALQAKVSQLESQLADTQRLLQMKNAELAALQSRPASPVAKTPAAPAAAPAPAAAKLPVPAPVPAPAPAAQPPAASATPPVAPAPAPAETARKAPTTPAPAGASSFTDLLVQYWYVPAALLAILIVLLVLRSVRARQEDAFDRSIGRLAGAAPEETASERASDTMPVRALPTGRDEQSYRVEESGSHEQPAAAAALAADTSASGRHVAIDDHVPAEAPVALDQGDPLAEADFHMAYGLYDQAADLVQIAISREPDRRDLRLKLLEVFFVWGNKDRFLQTARELASTRDKALPGEWEKIVIMGRQIAADDPLFAAAGSLPGAASGGVDLNLEGGQNRVDFDLMGEPSVTTQTSRSASGVDLDLGAALGETGISDSDPTGESRPISESGVDFVFDDAERGNDQTGTTREMPARSGQATTMTAAIASDADAPTVEQPQLPGVEDHPTIRQKIDAAKRGGMVPTEQTAELELHDLGLDLGALDAGGDETEIAPSPDAATVLASHGEDTRQLLHQAEHEPEGDESTRVASQPTDSGTWLFSDTDFVDVATHPGSAASKDPNAPTEIITQLAPRPDLRGLDTAHAQLRDSPSQDGSSTSRLQALESTGLDLDFGDLDKTQIREVPGSNGIDLDVGPSASGSEGTFVQTQRIMAEDVPLPDLEPATMSEVGTKLDLARAYMDMGDPEGARSILSEVLSEGSVSQKQEARRLIDTLPG
jgi:pilus assembly protein FimV